MCCTLRSLTSENRPFSTALLSQADSQRLPCYVETFSERHIPFYERHGFRIAGGGKIAASGPDFWALIR
jgi:hypothetical protein